MLRKINLFMFFVCLYFLAPIDGRKQPVKSTHLQYTESFGTVSPIGLTALSYVPVIISYLSHKEKDKGSRHLNSKSQNKVQLNDHSG